MSKIRASDQLDQTDEYNEDQKLISEDQLYPDKRVQTPVPNQTDQLPSAVEHQNKGQFDVIDIIEESQNTQSNQVLIDQTGMSPYDSRDENSRMQSAEGKRGDPRFNVRRINHAKSTSHQSEQQELITQINISSKEIGIPGENMSTTLDQQYFMKPGLSKTTTDVNKRLRISERPQEFHQSEEINFQTSEAEINDVPIRTKIRTRQAESTDSDEIEDMTASGSSISNKIEDQILKVAVNDLSEPKIQLSAFFDEDGIQRSMCRNIIQHPEKDQYYAASGEFGNELRLFDVKNIEKGNRKFECMMRRVKICPSDLQNEQTKMRKNLSEAFSFFRIVYDALSDQVPDILSTYNSLKKQIDRLDPKQPDANLGDLSRKFKQTKNQLKDIYINSFCILGDEDGHIVVGINNLQKAVLLKPTDEGPYIKIDEIQFDLKSLDKTMNIMQIEAASDCYEINHKTNIRQEYNSQLIQKQNELDQLNVNEQQKYSDLKKTKLELKRKYQVMYYKVFMLHKCSIFQTVKLTYHLVSIDQDGDENDGDLFFIKESKYPDFYKYSNEGQINKMKNEMDLRVGSSHFIINDNQIGSDTPKEELVVCVKGMGNIFKSCFEIRRFEDLSIKRHIKADFSASCILRDRNDVHCLMMSDDRKIWLVRASFEKLTQMDIDRELNGDCHCQIKNVEECFDGINAHQIVSAGPYLIIACMQKLTVIEKKLNTIVMQAETMGRIKCMTLSRNLRQLFIQTEDNYLYCILIDSITQIKHSEPGTIDQVPYQKVSKVLATQVKSDTGNHISSTLNTFLIAKGKQLWFQEKKKIYEESENIAYFPCSIQDMAMDNECSRIFILDERQQLYVYICEQNSIRHMMGFEHKAKMQLAYMPKFQSFNRATLRLQQEQGSLQFEEEKLQYDVHILITEGEDDDISFYKIHVPELSVLKEIDEDVKYGIYASNQLRYWGPIKHTDMFKVLSVCYFDKTIFALFQGQERDTKYLRRFDEYFDRQEDVKQDFRQLSRQIDDYQLEDEAFMTQTAQYLILSYRSKAEFILEDPKQRKRIQVFRTVDTNFLEQGFVVLSYFDGALVASLSQEGHYIVFRDIDQNQVIIKQELNFIPQQIIIDEQLQRIFITEAYQNCVEMKRLSKDFRQSFINESFKGFNPRRSSLKDKSLLRNNSLKAVQDGNGLGRVYEFYFGILLSKKNRDRQYNSLKKEMLRFQVHHATSEERNAYLMQENQFYTMVKMTANFVTVTSCMGFKEREMQQAISIGVPIVNDTSGKSPIHFAMLTNNMTSLNQLVEHYKVRQHYTPINMEDRDFLIQSFQSNWKEMFCFCQPIYFKEAQKMIFNGFHGIIREGKEIIYTNDSEISTSDIVQSVMLDKEQDQEYTGSQTIEGQTLRVKMNMHIETETCYNFLRLLKNANPDLLEQSDIEVIIKHSINNYKDAIVGLNMIHILQALCVLLKVTTEHSFFIITAILAITIILMQLYLIINDDSNILQNKLRLCSIIGNILAIVVALIYDQSDEPEEYEWTIQIAFQNYITSLMILLIFIRAIQSLTVFNKFSMLIESINQGFADMFHFIVLLGIIILMFSAMAFVTEPYKYEDRWFFEIFGERYRTIFGESFIIEYYYDQEGAPGWIIYILFTVVVHIVMLNLLIHLMNLSYMNVLARQKSIKTKSYIQMLLEIGNFQRLLNYRNLKKNKENQLKEQLYYVHRFVYVSETAPDELQATTWQQSLTNLSEKQDNILDSQKQIANRNALMDENIKLQMESFSGVINKQTTEIFKRLETQQHKTVNNLARSFNQLPQQSSTDLNSQSYQQVGDSSKIVQQIQQMTSKVSYQVDQKQQMILTELAKQQETIQSQNEQIQQLLKTKDLQDQVVKSPEKMISAEGKPSDDSTKQYINTQIATLSKSIKGDQLKTQSQITDVQNQVDQVVRKIGFLENAINEMKEAKENLANNQERLKDDIQNMLFDQKHQILGSIQQIMEKQKVGEEGNNLEGIISQAGDDQVVLQPQPNIDPSKNGQ